MITKQEIEQMLALLPESTEKLKQILNWASAYADVIGQKLMCHEDVDRIVMKAAGEINDLKAELKAAHQIADREREVRKRDIGALDSALLAQEKNTGVWKDLCQQMHRRVETLEAEAVRLHALWHNAEHKLTQIKALTSPDKTA